MLDADAKVKPLVRLCTVLFLVFVVSVGASFFQSPGMHEFQFHQTRYEQILTKVKDSGIKPGEYCRLWMTADLNPDSLETQTQQQRGYGGYVRSL